MSFSLAVKLAGHAADRSTPFTEVRMSGATPLLPQVPSWRTRGQCYLDLENIVTAGSDEQKVHLEFQYCYTHFPKHVPFFCCCLYPY